ncbi:TRAP transporter small permease subunit [Thermodesulfobacteriota bacterium]
MDMKKSILDRITFVGTITGAAFLMIVMLVVVGNIFFRLSGSAIKGTYEMVELFIVVTIAFALVYTAYNSGHVIIQIVISRIPPHIRKISEIITTLLSLGFWVTVTCAAINWIYETSLVGTERTFLLGIPVLPFKLVWVLCLLLLFALTLVDLIKVVKK